MHCLPPLIFFMDFVVDFILVVFDLATLVDRSPLPKVCVLAHVGEAGSALCHDNCDCINYLECADLHGCRFP